MQWITGVLAGLKALNPLKLARRNVELETKDAQREQELLALQDKLRKAESTLRQKAATHITPQGYLLKTEMRRRTVLRALRQRAAFS